MFERLKGFAYLAFLLLLIAPAVGAAQTTVQQVGPVTATHPSVWLQNGQVADSNQFPQWWSTQLDANFGSTPGMVLCRGPNGWTVVNVGTNGQFLQSGGAGVCPAWGNAAPGGVSQSGSVTAGDCTKWAGTNLIADQGAPCGGGGGTAVNITRAQIPATTIGTGQTISLIGFSVANDAGYGAVYTSTGATSAGPGAIQDAGGTWFNLVSADSNPGYFRGNPNSGATTISSGDITANPQWRGCYAVGTTWDTVGLQEAVYYANAAHSTAAPGGCTPATAPSSLVNIAWNATSAGGYNYALNHQINIPNGTWGVNVPIVQVASHFVQRNQSRSAIVAWVGSSPGTAWWCDACSYYQRFNFSIQVPTESYGAQKAGYINDWDGAYNSLKPQQGTDYDPYCAGSINAECFSISPSGGTAQGDTLTFDNPLCAAFDGLYCVRLGGPNALEFVVLNGDCQGFTTDCFMGFGGTYYLYGTHFENQNINSVNQNLPLLTQPTTAGADIHLYSGVSTAGSSLAYGNRAEDDVLSRAEEGAFTDVVGGYVVTADAVNWSASTFFSPGVITSQGGPTGIWRFLVVDAGGTRVPALATSATANTITDNTQSWSVNQWAGFDMFFRFGSNGFSQRCPIASNTATTLTGSGCNFGTWSTATMYQIIGKTDSSPPTWSGATKGYNTFNPGTSQGFFTTAGGFVVGYGSGVTLHTNDYVVIPNAYVVAPGGTAPAIPSPLYAKVVSTGTSCPGGFPGGISCATVDAAPTEAVTNAEGYACTPLTDNNLKWCPLQYPEVAGAPLLKDTGGINLVGATLGQVEGMAFGRTDWIDAASASPQLQNSRESMDIAARESAICLPAPGATVDLTAVVANCNVFTMSPTTGATTINIPAPLPLRAQVLHWIMPGPGLANAVTFGTNFNIPAGFARVWTTPAAGQFDFFFISDGAVSPGAGKWTEIAGPNLVGTNAVSSYTLGSAGIVGTGATVVCATSHVCDSNAGELTLTAGTGTGSTGLALTINFADTRTNIPACVVQQIDSTAGTAQSQSFIKSETTSTLAITATGTITASHVYTITYRCSGV